LLAAGYLPLGLVAVLLTASRGDLWRPWWRWRVAAFCCSAGTREQRSALVALPVLAAGLWFAVPHETFARLATIPEQIGSGDLNER